MKKIISVQGINIVFFEQKESDYLSLTDIAKYKNADDPRFVIQNWMRSRNTIEFMGFWETLYNHEFNRVKFDTFKNEAGSNGFVMTPSKWIESTGAIGIISKAGRYGGGTFAHKDIALKFASWISPEIELYIIKEFQRLKKEEYEKKALGRDIKRIVASMNYKIQTDAIQTHLIPTLTDFQQKYTYADEADIINIIVFGKTAKEWRSENSEVPSNQNIRDYANIIDLTLIGNLETHNAELIKQGIDRNKRFLILSDLCVSQKTVLQQQYKSSKKKLGLDIINDL